jgi:TonB family protein
VLGGVEGGVLGGVEGGAVGGVQKPEVEKKLQEFREGAVAVKDDLKPPKLIKKVDPVYPEEARKKGVQGVVILEAKIDESGRVMDAMILRSVPELDQAAIDAIRQWVYEPMLINGNPVKALFTVTVRFQLGEKDIEKFAEGAVKVKDQISPPKLVKIVEPVYPEIAHQAKVEGVVIVQARTDTRGRVKDAMILRSVPLLDQAALDAVRQWVYEPLLIDGQAREAVFTVTVRFALDKDKKKDRAEREEATGEALVPTLIKKVDPVYPEAARKAGIQGIVLLEATTDEQGNVVKVRVQKSIPELDQAAIDALKQWKYEPLIVEGKPKGVVFTVTVKFALK